MSTSAIRGLASIIIPCWSQLAFTKQCIAALERHTRQPWELVVIDNGSTDHTDIYLAGVQDGASVPVTVISNTTNLGFPAAINQGLKAARGEYLVLLNNDVVVTDGWLDQLMALANSRRGREDDFTAENAENAEKKTEGRGGVFRGGSEARVDTGSVDRTKQIAREFGAKVFDFVWIDDFAAARNEALSHATCDYAFWLDALIARVHQMMGNSQEALRTCALGLKLDPEDAELWFRKAVVHRHRGESAEAERSWRLILDLKRPDQFCSFDQGIYGHLTRRNLAVLAAERGDWAEAERLWREVLAECPGDHAATAKLQVRSGAGS